MVKLGEKDDEYGETSAKAIRNILHECHRLLKPGGITMHYDPQFSRGLDPHDSFMHDWDAYYNAEPFWGTLHECSVLDLMAEAGFARSKSVEFWGSFGPNLAAVLTPANDHESNIYRTTIFGAKASLVVTKVTVAPFSTRNSAAPMPS